MRGSQPDGHNLRCVFRVCRHSSVAINGKPRGAGEITCFVVDHIRHFNTVVAGGCAATKAVPWADMNITYEWCTHSRTVKKGIRRGGGRALVRHGSDQRTESLMVAKTGKHAGKLVQRLWIKRRGFHSNNVESLSNKLKRWARKRNGTLPRLASFKLYLSGFMLRQNCRSATLSVHYLSALRCVVVHEADIDM